MTKRLGNISRLLKACNDKINVLRDENANMFQVVYGADNFQSHLTIATLYLDPNQAFLLKQKCIDAKEGIAADINFIYSECHLVHFHSDPFQNTHEFITDDVFGVNLENDKVLAMTGDTLKNWVKMKAQITVE